MLAASVLLFSAVSCYKDLGNYDYITPNEIQISGIDADYTIMAGETLVLSPSITSSDGANPLDTSRFLYQWRKELSPAQLIDLGDELELSVHVGADKFTLNEINPVYFVVIDKQTATRSQFLVNVNVTTETSYTKRGWYVLSEVGEGARLSLISHMTEQPVLYTDVLSSLGSSLDLLDQGRPFSLAIDRYSNLSVSTEKNAVILPVLDGLDWDKGYTVLSQFIVSPPANTVVEYAGPLDVQTRETNIVFAHNNYYIESPQYEDFYGIPINQYAQASTTFKASPYFGAFWQERGILMFDEDNREFALYRLSFAAASTTTVLTLPVEGQGTAVLPTNKDLRYMSKVRYPDERGQTFAIMKGSDNRYSLLRFEGRTTSRTTIVLKAPEEYITATDFDKAEHITFHPIYGYIYYNVGSKIYAYDPIGTKTSKLMLDLQDEKISLLEFDISNGNAYATHREELNKLTVGTYNPSGPVGENGKLSFYNVPSAMGAITPVGNVYTGFGIIKDAVFVTN